MGITSPEPIGDMSQVPMTGSTLNPALGSTMDGTYSDPISMNRLFNGIDASIPPNIIPADFGTVDIICGYVGESGSGSPDTPHIWNVPEWNEHLEGHPETRCLPIYTHSYPGDPETDAQNAVDAVLALGWKPHIGRFIAFDLETLVDVSYVSEVIRFTYAKGFRMIPYGSAFYVAQNPAPWNRWGALLTPLPPTRFPNGFTGIQWKFNDRGWDRSVFSATVYANCGRGLRREA